MTTPTLPASSSSSPSSPSSPLQLPSSPSPSPSSQSPSIVFYADDFTGATDTLATAARAGLRTLLFLGAPTPAQIDEACPLDCLGVAGAARSMGPASMRAELAPIADLFRRSGARVLHYKTCSTFDSAPDVGSIGTAIEVLRPATAQPWTAIIGGQPQLGRYCLFGNLFAAAGSGGEVHRIDRHPTMSRHPVTPMHEADLRRHLALQGVADVCSLPYTCYADDDAASAVAGDTRHVAHQARHALDALLARRPDGVLFDVGDDTHLDTIGRLLWSDAKSDTLLAVGPSSVVQALAPQLGSQPPIAEGVAAARGPVLVVAGSLSPVTARQVAAARSFTLVSVNARRLVDDVDFRQATAQQLCALLREGRHVLACTVRPGDEVQADNDVSALALARAGGALLAQVLADTPLSRIGIAGGDTSSYAVKALDAWGLSYRAALSSGVALCRLHSRVASLDGLEVALKGGQMGTEDVFERLIGGTA